VTAARVLTTPRRELFPLAENEVEKKYFNSRKCVFKRRTRTKVLGFHFWTPYPLFKKNEQLQVKELGRRFWLIRSLRVGSQSATTK